MKPLPFLLFLLTLLRTAPAAAEPLHYRIGATFLPDIETAAVDVTVTLPDVAVGQTARFVLGNRFTIIRAEAEHAGSASVKPTDKPWSGLQEISLRFSRAATRPRVRLLYHGRVNPTGELPINQIGPNLVEVSLDGMWLPILPGLDGPFTVDAMLSGLPAGSVVAAQGDVERRGDRVFVRRDLPEIDFAFAASPAFRVEEGPAFRLYAADPAAALARLYTDHGMRARAFLSQWLGDLGGDRIRLAIVPRPRRSGYARRHFIVTTDQGEAPQPPNTAKFIAHELAHLWFANANATTADRWLDESTSEYLGLRYVEKAFGREERDRMLAAKRPEAAKAPPLLGGPPTSAGIYAKGPLLLFALEERIGRERLDGILGEAARTRTARTPDFLAIVAKLSSPADAQWFEEQLRH